MHTVNCDKTLKHKGNKFLHCVNVNICSTVPCSKLDHNSTQLHLLTQNYCTLQLFSSCSYTLQPNTEMKELKFARWCMTCWIFLTLRLDPLTATLFKLLLLMTGLLFPLQGITRNLDNQLLNMGHLHLSSSDLSTLSNRMRKNAQNSCRSTQFVCSSNVLLSNLILTNQNTNWSLN